MTEAEKLANPVPWRQWGPYLSDRQWGTVREDYSAEGDAWNSTTHDMARSKAWRWGEEGIAGFSDQHQHLCLALALWNEKDPFLKERFFGLSNQQGNHGEDVKEQYYHLDGLPSHSFMRLLYKYPQQRFPYEELMAENARRSKQEAEFELLDTGIFNNNEYFDVFVAYAKAGPQDLLVQYTVVNRNSEAAHLHLLPQLWYRHLPQWDLPDAVKPSIHAGPGQSAILESETPGRYYAYAEGDCQWLFTNNETNFQKLYGVANHSPFVKDGINDFVVEGKENAVNPQRKGTKAAAHYRLHLAAGETKIIRFRLSHQPLDQPFADFDQQVHAQQVAANWFYEKLHKTKHPDARYVQRQAWAGLLWNKQFYHLNVHDWLDGDDGQPRPPESRKKGRNSNWQHFSVGDVISMPDKWEFPWFAAWDLAFQCIAFAGIDAAFAKDQLLLLLRTNYLHPNGELPAYEWNFSDVNPPVHALAAWRIFETDARLNGSRDHAFLEKVFHKLLLNFTWWINRIDAEGNNIFEGGFLGLDNIGVFNRSEPLPGGGSLEQADGTSWMAAYCLQMLTIASELAVKNPVYEEMCTKFAEHFFFIAGAMANMAGTRASNDGLWDDQDEFYYDMIRMPDGQWQRLKLRSLVGLMPLIAVAVLRSSQLDKLPHFVARLKQFMADRPDLAALVSHWEGEGADSLHLLSLLRGHRMKCLLQRMLNEAEFLSPHGIRSLSREYEQQPFRCTIGGREMAVHYLPAESDSSIFGGNSNWRGPVWMPLNYLLVESLYTFHSYYGDDFKIEMPTGSGQFITIREAADQLVSRLTSLFLKDERGWRPVHGQCALHQTDPQFSPYLLFYEYFDGNTGKGLGASHQTGWTALVAMLLQEHLYEET